MEEEANWQYRDTERDREAEEQDESSPTTATPAWDPVYSSLVDAAVLRSGADICLRSYSHPATVGVDVDAPQETYQLASLVGVGLGRPQEILTLQKVVSTDSQDDNVVVRHGDTIMLHSAIAGNLALGSRKFVHSATGSSKVQLGFFGHGGKAELWTIFPARPDQEILVGPAALAYPQKDPIHKQKISKSIPLRSSDPIILRNVYNGGILSIDSNGLLVLLTDSYQHDQHYTEDPSLLGRLQQHNRMMPTPEDTFQMILTQTPPCPPWIAQGGSEERIFLTGSYFLQEGRNEPNIHLESGCFPRDVTYSNVLQAAQRYVASDENMSPKTKERILMDEVIGSFLGLEGVHIRMQATKGANDAKEWFEFRLVAGDEVTFDAGLRNLVDQILPLSTSFVRVRNFVSSHQPGYEYGRVMQAFCEAIDALLQDYVNFVSHLEWELRRYAKADTLTIKSIYFQAAPSIHSMSILEHATEAVAECKGGELINKLWALDKRSYMGDTVAKKVLGILLEKASEPYMEIMSDWLQTGRLNDPSGEFMVQRCAPNARTVLDGDSWFTLFQINEEHVLQGIAPNNWTKDKILTTGKYWNAVQDCHLDSKDIQRPTRHSKIPSLPFNSDSSAIAAYIDAKYQSASKVLVRILIENFKIMESLQIMKRYFLVDQGDFLMHFMDAAEQELLKPRDEISMGRLQHWLNMSVQFTEAHKEDWGPVSGLRIPSCPLIPAGLRCRLSDESLVSHLDSRYGGGIADRTPVTPSRRAYGMSTHVTGIEVFTIDFPHIPFPISLLMSQKAMDEYRLLFRHLFFTKHVERRLIGVWKDNQLLKKLGTLRGPLGSTFLLRQKMLHLVQNLIYYMVYEVVESNWTDMRNALDDRSDGNTEKPQTVDDMLNIHNSFLERTLEACLLTNSDLIRSLTKLMNTCLLFTDQMRRFMDTTKIVSVCDGATDGSLSVLHILLSP
jgi:gamma-tubulin complex component 2